MWRMGLSIADLSLGFGDREFERSRPSTEASTMPRYFFHLHDGKDLPDHDGRDLPDIRAAQAHAAEIVYHQLKGDAGSSKSMEEWTLVVQSSSRTLFTLRFKAAEME